MLYCALSIEFSVGPNFMHFLILAHPDNEPYYISWWR